MAFLLSSENAFDYLAMRGLCDLEEQHRSYIEPKSCKNFNLLIRLPNQRYFLIKQEPYDRNGSTKQDLQHEWKVHQLVQKYVELQQIQPLLSKPIDFNIKDSIAIFDYLTDYWDLDDFYAQEQRFPVLVAAALGATVAEVHRATLDQENYQRFLNCNSARSDDDSPEQVPDLLYGLERLTYKQLGTLSTDGLKFYELFQRYESLTQAIAELNDAYEPCCLIHNDLKFNNVLLLKDWQTTAPVAALPLVLEKQKPLIRLIDWEKWVWGDPAADLGSLIANYLKLWLKSLVVRAGIELDMSLRLASIPLETLHPSLVALIQAYLAQFPQVLERWPDFLVRVMQFAGFNLIEAIEAKLHYHEPFGNIEICMLQVAKTLLYAPVQSIPTVFGRTVAELLTIDQIVFKDESTVVSMPTPASSAPSISPTFSLSSESSDHATLLNDLICNIRIQANGHIVHLNCISLEPLEHFVNFHRLPQHLQQQFLRMQLRNCLYDIYFSGEALSRSISVTSTTTSTKKLENNTLRGLNLKFYQQLEANNCGKGYLEPGWQVLRQELDSSWVIQKAGLTVHVSPNEYPDVFSPFPGEPIELRLPAGRIEAEFYIAVGDAGWVSEEIPVVELCFNISPEGAVQLMRHFTEQLNALRLPFSFKVLIDPETYGRLDAAILQIAQSHYKIVHSVLQSIYPTVSSYLQAGVPLFMKPLGPGVGLAEEPQNEPADFGMHRFQLVADALLMVRQMGDESPENRLRAIQQQFTQHGIDWQRPYLNPHGQDIYMALDEQTAKT
jgi:thiamine kinase-like enzyme